MDPQLVRAALVSGGLILLFLLIAVAGPPPALETGFANSPDAPVDTGVSTRF